VNSRLCLLFMLTRYWCNACAVDQEESGILRFFVQNSVVINNLLFEGGNESFKWSSFGMPLGMGFHVH